MLHLHRDSAGHLGNQKLLKMQVLEPWSCLTIFMKILEMLSFLCQSQEKLGRSFNSYYGRGHGYTCSHTCTWLLDCAVKTEATFQYFLFAELKILTSNQPPERGMQQCEGAGNLKQGYHTRKNKQLPHATFIFFRKHFH